MQGKKGEGGRYNKWRMAKRNRQHEKSENGKWIYEKEDWRKKVGRGERKEGKGNLKGREKKGKKKKKTSLAALEYILFVGRCLLETTKRAKKDSKIQNYYNYHYSVYHYNYISQAYAYSISLRK